MRQQLREAVTNSQHCYRNFDLEAQIPQEDLDLMIHAATQAPAKQNYSYFNLKVITNQDIIGKVHENTIGATINNKTTGEKLITTNSQTLANVLFVYESKTFDQMSEDFIADQEIQPHDLEWQFNETGSGIERDLAGFKIDRDRHLGISSGQLVLVANMLGYRTGYCACFQSQPIKELLQLQCDDLMLVGIGIPHQNKTRTEYYKDGKYNYMTKSREQTNVEIINAS